MNAAKTAASYNATPYPRFTFHQTHPNRIATIGHLLGMDVADITQCRVLELGCASGTNIIPMAAQFPNSTFIGIDLSSVQIAAGQQIIDELGLTNIHLQERDLTEFPDDEAPFDYIIAHGVFSWVPEDVRHAILDLVKRQLAPQGIAYISYNTYPGWHVTDSARDLMKFYTRNLDDPVEKAKSAIEILQWMKQVVSDETNHAFGALLETYLHQLDDQLQRNDNRHISSLLHDELGDINQPYYFHQFVSLIGDHGLQYLAESHFASVMPSDFPPETIVQLNHMSGRDHIRREQYMDFLRLRRFRQSLVVHDDVAIQRSISPERIRNLYMTTRAEPDFESDPHQLPTHYSTPRGMNFEVDNAATAAALVTLHANTPVALTVGELLAGVREVLGLETIPLDAVNVLLVDLLQLFSIHEEFLTLRKWRPDLPHNPPSPVQVWEVSRRFARDDGYTVNQWHERIDVPDLAGRLLPYFDGQHTHADLIGVMQGWLDEGTLNIEETHADDDRVVYLLSKELDAVIDWLMANALVINS